MADPQILPQTIEGVQERWDQVKALGKSLSLMDFHARREVEIAKAVAPLDVWFLLDELKRVRGELRDMTDFADYCRTCAMSGESKPQSLTAFYAHRKDPHA